VVPTTATRPDKYADLIGQAVGLRLDSVSREFGGDEEMRVTAIRDVSIEIGPCEFVSVVGPSGCGKTTLLSMMGGLDRPTSGHVYAAGRPLGELSDHDLADYRLQRVSTIFQSFNLVPSMSVEDNVALPLEELTDKSPEEIDKVVDEKLDLVGMKDSKDLMPAELSGGMKKRVGIARALVLEPELILFDEPSAGLDPVIASVIDELIISLTEKSKVTSITVTHEMDSAFRIGTRMAMLYQGKIIEDAEPEKFKKSENPVVAQFLSGSTEGPILEGSLDAITKK